MFGPAGLKCRDPACNHLAVRGRASVAAVGQLGQYAEVVGGKFPANN